MKKGFLFFAATLSLMLLNSSPARSADPSYSSTPASIIGRCPSAAVANIYTFAAENIVTMKDVHNELAQLMAFPSYYGANLDALEEVLRDFYHNDATIIFWPHSTEIATGLKGEFEKMMAVFADVSQLNEQGLCVILQ